MTDTGSSTGGPHCHVRARRFKKGHALGVFQPKAGRQSLGDLGGGSQFIRLDLPNSDGSAADLLRKRLLSQVERLAPASQPVTERSSAFHGSLLLGHGVLYRSLYRKPIFADGAHVL